MEIKVEVLPRKRREHRDYEGDFKQGRRLRFNSMEESRRAERDESETISGFIKRERI